MFTFAEIVTAHASQEVTETSQLTAVQSQTSQSHTCIQCALADPDCSICYWQVARWKNAVWARLTSNLALCLVSLYSWPLRCVVEDNWNIDSSDIAESPLAILKTSIRSALFRLFSKLQSPKGSSLLIAASKTPESSLWNGVALFQSESCLSDSKVTTLVCNIPRVNGPETCVTST